MRWIVTGVALAVVALAGADVARACGGCCKGGGSGCPSCPQGGPSAGRAAPAACPNCPRAETASGGDRSPGGVAGYSPYPAPGHAGYTPSAPVVYSTSYLPPSRPVQTTSRYERPAR